MPDLHKDILYQVFCVAGIAKDPHSEAEHRGAVMVVQLAKRGVVAVPRPFDELSIAITFRYAGHYPATPHGERTEHYTA